MATESFFIHIELTEKDENIIKELINYFEDENTHYYISQEKVKEVRQKEEEGTKEVLKWLQTF